jgi:hypothetical protein
MEKLLKEKIQPAVRLSNSALKAFTFTKVHFGHKVSLLSSLTTLGNSHHDIFIGYILYHHQSTGLPYGLK